MKKIATYLMFSFSLLLLSCSNEEILSYPDEEEKVEMTVSIEIASGKNDELETKATGQQADNTCEVDKIRLFIYSGESSVTDRNQLKYDSEQTLDCKKEGEKWVARGSITGISGKKYSIFALGYNNTKESSTFSIENNTADHVYGDAKVKLNITKAADYNECITPELFAGNVHPKGEEAVFIATGEEQKLTGTLYRAVGKCSITLNNIPGNIKELTWVTEKIADSNIFYRTTGHEIDKYPMGIPQEDELNLTACKASSIQNSTNEVWNATLSSLFIPLTKSFFFIDATDDKGAKIRYIVKCADKWSHTIWLGYITYFVQAYRFSTFPNYQIKIEGTFDKLQNSGNLLIDLTPMEEYDGGLLS